MAFFWMTNDHVNMRITHYHMFDRYIILHCWKIFYLCSQLGLFMLDGWLRKPSKNIYGTLSSILFVPFSLLIRLMHRFTKTSSYLSWSRSLKKHRHCSWWELCNSLKLLPVLSGNVVMSSFTQNVFDTGPKNNYQRS